MNKSRAHKTSWREVGIDVLAIVMVVAAAGALIAHQGHGARSVGTGPGSTLPPTGSPASTVSATRTHTTPKPLEAEIIGLDGHIRRRFKGLPPDARQLSLSPDGKSIAFTRPVTPHRGLPVVSEMGVFSIHDRHWFPIQWGDSKWEPLGADWPSWSPDGTRLAFVSTTWGPRKRSNGIDVVILGGGAHRRLTGPVANPRWSPDGNEFVYARIGRPDRIYVTAVRASHARELAAGAFPVFSPDGSRIAFVGRDHQIVIVNIDGTRPMHYLSGRSYPQALAWSPDGTKIAFLSGSCGQFKGQGVSIMEVATGSVTTLVPCRPGGVGSGPSWVPSSDALLIGGA
jgi:Tol biopolymer transport system component